MIFVNFCECEHENAYLECVDNIASYYHCPDCETSWSIPHSGDEDDCNEEYEE